MNLMQVEFEPRSVTVFSDVNHVNDSPLPAFFESANNADGALNKQVVHA